MGSVNLIFGFILFVHSSAQALKYGRLDVVPYFKIALGKQYLPISKALL